MQMPKVIFVPCVNSHSFEKREIEVYEEVKVGRSVARCKTSPDNAIFDCKVLSRSHAVMWFQDGFIWIKDTSSSNGTFINSNRLSRGGEESEPFKIQSGDKIQFGVDVMEAKKKDGGGNPITHGCIIAKATVIIPDTLIPNPNYVINNPLLNSKSVSSSSETLDCIDEDQDILDLHGAIKNAMNRENLLHLRLQELEGRLSTAIDAAELGWQALIKEDKLLARIELLENQLEIFTRNPSEDQTKILQLESEKHDYQIHAKDSLRAICLEKSDVTRKCSDLENLLTTARIEVGHYKNLHETVQTELIKAQDEVRRKTTELETKEAEFQTSCETALAEHKATVDELTKNMEGLVATNTELLEQRDLLEKQLDSIANEHGQQIESLQSSITTLREELESAADKKQAEVVLTEENSALKSENYRLQEDLVKLKEELEAGTAAPNLPVEVETDSAAEKSLDRQYIDVSTNTDDVRETEPKEGTTEEQEVQLNPVVSRDSMSQTEKWFDAISPSSSKSDILSASFTAGDKRYRSLRSNRREGPRPWSNSSAFEGSIAHAMALIESLDDIKSSCVKFREETESNDVELSIDSGELSVTDDSSYNKHDISHTISPPPRRRNSYREACEDEETAGTTTIRPDDTFDDASEADEHYELAPEDSGDKPSVILNKVLHMLPEIIDGVGTSVDILDSMSHMRPPPPRPPTPPSTPTPSPRPFPAGRRGVQGVAGSPHHHPMASSSPAPLGVVPRPPPRTHRKVESARSSPKPPESPVQSEATISRSGGFRRKTVPHGKDAGLRGGGGGSEAPAPPGTPTSPRPCIDLYKLTPIPPLRNYRKPAWVQD